MRDRPPGRRVVVNAFGEDPLDALDHHLAIEDQPAPDVGALGPRDVVVAVKSAAVGWVDLLMTSGQYQHQPPLPYTPGLEWSGEVVWMGAEVEPGRLASGDRVLADGLLTGPRSSGAYQRYGGFASYAVAPAEALLRLPAPLTFDQGCNLLGNYETAYHCLVHCGQLKAGETVLIHGASGSTGLAAVHIARLVGARVIATGRSPAKLEEVRAEGAHHVVRTTDDQGAPRAFRDDVKALTDGEGVDVVYDGVGGDISLESLRCVRFGARFLIVGWAATPFVARGRGLRGAPNANVLPTHLILMKGLHVLGCPTVIATQKDPSIRAARLEQILRWVEQGEVSPKVSATFPLSQVREAMRAKWESRFAGGCVIHPGD